MSYYGYSTDSKDTDWKVVLPIAGLAAGAGLGALFSPSLERTEYQFTLYSKEEKLRVLQSLIDDKTGLNVPRVPKTNIAQNDVVYLKNGSIIRGNVMEIIPDSSIKISTSDGSLFVFKMSEVERIAKSEAREEARTQSLVKVSQPTNSSHSSDNEPIENLSERKVRSSIRGGISIPTGNFAATSGNESGAAVLGFGLGAEVLFPFDASGSVGGNVTIASNSIDVGGAVPAGVDIGSWTSVWLMLAGQVQTTSASSTQGYLQARLGLLIASPPSLKSSSTSVEYSTGVGFAYGLAGGLVFSERLKIEAAFVAGRPEFTATLRNSGAQVTATGKLPVNIVMITAGYSLGRN